MDSLPFDPEVFGTGHSFERALVPRNELVLFDKRWEAFRPKRYPDGKRKDGSTVWSICYGHAEDGDTPPFKITEDMEFTEQEGTEILIADLKRKLHFIDVRVKVPLTTFMHEALSSCVFQYGNGRLERTTEVLNILNNADDEGNNYVNAAIAMLDLFKDQSGKPRRGLKLRRAAEVTWFITKKD